MGTFNSQPVIDFIGKGLAFPIELVNGSASLSSGVNIIKSSIATILAYSLGQRFFLGEFGTRINDLIEEPNMDLLQNVLENFITKSLTTWEKRITITSIETIEVGLAGLEITIYFSINNTQIEDNFVWPFYKEINN